jgi:hypothetical protein
VREGHSDANIVTLSFYRCACPVSVQPCADHCGAERYQLFEHLGQYAETPSSPPETLIGAGSSSHAGPPSIPLCILPSIPPSISPSIPPSSLSLSLPLFFTLPSLLLLSFPLSLSVYFSLFLLLYLSVCHSLFLSLCSFKKFKLVFGTKLFFKIKIKKWFLKVKILLIPIFSFFFIFTFWEHLTCFKDKFGFFKSALIPQFFIYNMTYFKKQIGRKGGKDRSTNRGRDQLKDRWKDIGIDKRKDSSPFKFEYYFATVSLIGKNLMLPSL